MLYPECLMKDKWHDLKLPWILILPGVLLIYNQTFGREFSPGEVESSLPLKNTPLSILYFIFFLLVQTNDHIILMWI